MTTARYEEIRMRHELDMDFSQIVAATGIGSRSVCSWMLCMKPSTRTADGVRNTAGRMPTRPTTAGWISRFDDETLSEYIRQLA